MPVGGLGKRPLAESGKPVPGNHHAVVAVAGAGQDHGARLAVHRHGLGRIVVARIEDGHVRATARCRARSRCSGRRSRRCSFWVTFHESCANGFVHAAAEDGVGALAEFGVGVEQAQRGIRRRVAAESLPERVSVNVNWPFWLLVQVGQALTLISSLSFSPDSLEENAELERVAALDPGEAVGQRRRSDPRSATDTGRRSGR